MLKDTLIEKLQNYLSAFSDSCIAQKINTADITIDHICYKCESSEEFEQIKKLFEFDDKFIYQSIVSKRRIAYIGFSIPLTSVCGNTYYLELSDQKPDNSQKSKVDHIEPIPNGISYEEMLKRFSATGIEMTENVKPHHSTQEMIFPNNIRIKLGDEPLVDKIYRDEFVLKG